jgi:hypothetical protein
LRNKARIDAARVAELARINDNMSKLSPVDQQLARNQVFCAIDQDSRLGSMGPPVKLTLAGETVFLCCSGCKGQATADPERTAARAKELRSQSGPGGPR